MACVTASLLHRLLQSSTLTSGSTSFYGSWALGHVVSSPPPFVFSLPPNSLIIFNLIILHMLFSAVSNSFCNKAGFKLKSLMPPYYASIYVILKGWRGSVLKTKREPKRHLDLILSSAIYLVQTWEFAESEGSVLDSWLLLLNSFYDLGQDITTSLRYQLKEP